MKKNFIIVLGLMCSLTGAFVYIANAQERDKCPSIVQSISTESVIDTTFRPSPDTTLLADETTLIYYENTAKIICDNEKIFDKLYKTFYQLFKYKIEWKSDGKRYYKHYTIFINPHDARIIYRWAKKNL